MTQESGPNPDAWMQYLSLEDVHTLFERYPVTKVQMENVVANRRLEEARVTKSESDIKLGEERGKYLESDKVDTSNPKEFPS